MLKTSCLLCHNKKHKKLYGIGKFDILKCINCGLVFLSPSPTEKELKNYYSSNYYSRKANILENILDFINRYILLNEVGKFKKRGKLLEVGFGNGELLDFFKKRGWETYGVETSKQAFNLARVKIKDNIYNKPLVECHFKKNYFDLVILSHVIEHIKDPLFLLSGAKRVLNKEGVLIIEVPSLDSIEYFLSKENYFAFVDMPGHLYFFTQLTIKRLLMKAGFKVLGKGITFFILPVSLIKSVNAKIKHRLMKLFLFPIILLLTVLVRTVDIILGRNKVVRYYFKRLR